MGSHELLSLSRCGGGVRLINGVTNWLVKIPGFLNRTEKGKKYKKRREKKRKEKTRKKMAKECKLEEKKIKEKQRVGKGI